MQTWNSVNQTSNTWADAANPLYVVAGYWVDGYTLDQDNQWTSSSFSTNSWTIIET